MNVLLPCMYIFLSSASGRAGGVEHKTDGSSSAAGASKSAMGLSSRCGCRCECVTTHGDRSHNNNDGPDAVLEGLAMAGLVAILRQLGDLAELAAEVFDDMQGQVMAASARGRRLAVRAKLLLEADLDLPPPASTHNSAAAALTFTTSSSGSGRLGCRAHLRGGGGVGGGGGTPPMMPRLVVQRLRRCRGPPRLSLLDKFDAAGEGACLKRYTDPSFFFRAHSARQLEQGALRLRANRGLYLLKSMSMETSRPKFQAALYSEPPESAHTDSKSETETETDADASEAPSPGFLSMLRHLKQHQHQHRQAAAAGSLFRMQQAVDRVESSPQLDLEKKLQAGGTVQRSPSPSELERTSSFEAWLAPDARRFTTATRHNEHDEIITQEPQPPHPHGGDATTCSGSVSDVATTSNGALSSSTMLNAKQNSADAEIPCSSKSSSKRRLRRYRGSVEMIASRVSSLPRKLFININDRSRSDRAATSLRISQATGIGDCNPELEAIPTPREAFLPILVHSDPVYSSIHSLLPENDKCSNLQHHESISCNVSVDAERHHQQEDPSTDQCSNSNSNSSTPETIGDTTRATPDSGSLVLKRAGALPPENSSSEDAKVDTTPPLPPIPPMQWLPERDHTGTRAPSPKHRALWKKSLEVTEMIQAIRRAHSHSIQTSPVDTEETLVSDENTTSANASHRNEMKCSESEETRHPQPFRVREDAVHASSEGNVLKAGEFPVPVILSDEAWSEIDLRTQAQADTCFQQQGRQQSGSSGHSDEKRSQEHEASDSSSNLQNESVFFSAVQELAKVSPPPSVTRPRYSMLDAGSHGRITLRNGPSLIHPSRNILDSKSVMIKQIKDIAMAGDPSFKLKPVSGASSPQSPVTGSPTNSKVATILQRADDIRKAHADSKDVDGEESWSDDSE